MNNPNNLGDYLRRKSEQLSLERGDQLAQIQSYLDELYPGQCRAVSLNNGVLLVATSSASLASELRLGRPLQPRLVEYGITKIRIQIRT